VWESKPVSHFCGTWIDFEEYKIPVEYETEANRNPDTFKRDFMAMPALALSPYLKQYDMLEKCIDPTRESPFDEQNRFKQSFRGKKKTWYYIHVDLSHKRDATGFAMAHNEGTSIIIDLMLQIKAPPGGEIYFSQIREMIFELGRRDFKIDGISFDGWQSIDSIQLLEQKGFECSVFSVDASTSGYDTMKEQIYEGKLKCYRYEPFLEEMRRLELINGTKVDHPPHGSKDVSDAVAGAVYHAVLNINVAREMMVMIC